MWVRSLGQEDTLEEDMAIHSGILDWRYQWTETFCPSEIYNDHMNNVKQNRVSRNLQKAPVLDLTLTERWFSWKF